jgi:hypothetical protein
MGRMIFPGQAVLLREVPVLQVSAQSRDSPGRVDDQPRPPHAPSIGARPSPRGGSGSRCGTTVRHASGQVDTDNGDAVAGEPG